MKPLTLDDLRDGKPHEPPRWALRPITPTRRAAALREVQGEIAHVNRYAFRNGEPAAVAAGGK